MAYNVKSCPTGKFSQYFEINSIKKILNRIFEITYSRVFPKTINNSLSLALA